jgi:hypothetical protein
MNIRVKLQAVQPGIMGKMILAIQTVASAHLRKEINIDNIDILNIYCEGQSDKDFFNYVLDQPPVDKFDKVYEWQVFPQVADISSHENFLLYKKIAKKINIKKKILEKIPAEIDENTVGLHIRLTDMNSLHSKDYGHRTLDSYLHKLEEVISENNIKKIFVASDNLESLSKIKSKYDVIINDVNIRNKTETDSGYNDFLRKNHNDYDLWNSTFIDSMSLSRCGYVIKGVSSFSNIPIIFSSSLKRVYTL